MHHETGVFCHTRPGIAVGRMEPAAAKVEGPGSGLQGPCTTADPGQGFEDGYGQAAPHETAGGADACSTRPDNHNIYFRVHPSFSPIAGRRSLRAGAGKTSRQAFAPERDPSSSRFKAIKIAERAGGIYGTPESEYRRLIERSAEGPVFKIRAGVVAG